MKKKEPLNFIEPKHIKYIILFALVCYLGVYLSFCGKGCIPPGENLEKSDWLSFVGGFLSFIGTIAVSWAALWQTKHYNDLDEQRREEERMRSVQPVFYIDLWKESFYILDEEGEDIEVRANVILITHIGEHPISHVIVFDKYMSGLMINSSSLSLTYGFEEITSKINKKSVITLTEDAFDRHEKYTDMPKYFNICYDDVDGRCMCQIFKLMEYDQKIYYSLEETFEA